MGSLKKSGSAVHNEAGSLSFGLFSSWEIRNLSSVEITNPVSFNQLGHPLPGGLYDLKMGGFSSSMECSTCFLNFAHCPGHLGHLELPLPVVNPLLYSTILKILKISCVHCHEFHSKISERTLFLIRQKLLDVGLIVEAQNAKSIISSGGSFPEEEEEEEEVVEKEGALKDTLVTQKLKKYYEDVVPATKNKRGSVTRNIEALKKYYVKEYLGLFDKKMICSKCGSVSKAVLYKGRFIFESTFLDKSNRKVTDKTELNPEELKRHLRGLWRNDSELFGYLFPIFKMKTDCSNPTDSFFIDVLAVVPPKMRPCQYSGKSLNLHPQSISLQTVVETVTILKQILRVMQKDTEELLPVETRDMIKSVKGETTIEKIDTIWKELQISIDHVLDRELNSSNKATGWGFKQLIERKTGIFRMHMMGKRVNFAARTVITPDPYIDIDEIGLPEVFAKKLSYRVPVTPWNVEELRELVMNGPDVHPGALHIETESGHRKFIDPNNPIQRKALAKTLLTPTEPGQGELKYVYRHLKNGDCMLLNRQPTLHKPSIMSHRARVLKGEKVMRLHYAVCKSYNADFDGDEMNAHFPQNEVARSEARNIVNVCEQYLVPKDGTPLQGLIQDHVIAGVKMTVRGKFFTCAEYQQHVYSALINVKGTIKTLPPAILKPVRLWSGKQIISTIILNSVPVGKQPVTLLSSTKVKPTEWINAIPRTWNTRLKGHVKKKGCGMCESEVVFSQGELVSGVMDKNQYGTTMYSLVHTFFELYGGSYSSALLSSFSRIFTNFLRTEGFTLGVSDILVCRKANKKRSSIMSELRNIGDSCASAGVSLQSGGEDPELIKSELHRFHRESFGAPQKRMKVDKGYKENLGPMTNKINSTCLPSGLIKKFPDNNLQLMVQAGAKGSTVNTMQISCLLGQIELEGKRPPLMISGRSLPSFLPYDTQPRSGGFIDGRFMSGIKPQEFFFHCMAGREGLIDTAVKTSRSGYLQRCLIKLLEGLVVNYDLTVRDSDDSVIQFQYGEDSLDVCKSQFLVNSQIPFLEQNMHSVIDASTRELISKHCKANESEVNTLKNAIRISQNKKKNRNRDSAFLHFCRKYKEIPIPNQNVIDKKSGRSQLTQRLINTWTSNKDIRIRYDKKFHRVPDPCGAIYRPDSNYGSVTEKVEELISNYIEKYPRKANIFRETMYMKFMKCMVDPGEPVGVLAGQSIGEPSTQMTLNTFHFAGCGEMNVTLGIPRLREILMVAAENIKTPSSTLPFLDGVSDTKKERLRLQLNRCTMADVLETVTVSEKIIMKKRRSKIVKMNFQFLPRKSYKHDYCVHPSSILRYFENSFINKDLMPLILTSLSEKVAVVEISSMEKTGKEFNEREEGENVEESMVNAEKRGDGEGHASSDEEDQPDDADASDMKKKNRQMDDDYDEGLSDEEVELMNALDNHEDSLLDEVKCEEVSSEERDCNDENSFSYMRHISQSEAERRRAAVVHSLGYRYRGGVGIADYRFDMEEELWAELTLKFSISNKKLDISNIIKKAAKSGVIHEIKKINKAFITKNEQDESTLTIDGINIEAMFNYDHILDLTRLRCNNIHDMARYYGIEAANKTIAVEIINVFKAYGITVNARHLSLIADYMTFDGSYRPFNRIGIENNTSPLQQMTFETAIGFLRSATLGGKTDNLHSPSSCIVLGKPWLGGTSSFKLMQNVSIE